MRQQMKHTAGRTAFHITLETAEKLKTISPVAIGRYLKKNRAALALKGKNLAKPLYSLKSRIPPIRTFCSGEERNKPGFRQIDTVRRCGQVAQGQYVRTLTAAGWLELRSLLNNAHFWTFKALSDIKTTIPFPVLEFHRQRSCRVTTARNLSITPPASGVKKKTSLSPAHGTAKRTAIVSRNKKTAPLSANTRDTTTLRSLRNRRSWSPYMACFPFF
jgi:hypothetical protein